jgi:hypothetical protein
MSVAAVKTKPTPYALARVFAPISDVKTRPDTAEEAANVAALKEEFAL